MRRAILFGGVNGAGKTTFARRVLALDAPGVPFLNADEIQRELGPEASPVTAGRLLLERLAAHIAAGESFALESTLASANFARMMPDWRAQGYLTTLHYIELPSADAAVARVAKRAAAGGHDIPEADIRRRYARSLQNFHRVYKLVADEWFHYVSEDGHARLIDEGATETGS